MASAYCARRLSELCVGSAPDCSFSGGGKVRSYLPDDRLTDCRHEVRESPSVSYSPFRTWHASLNSSTFLFGRPEQSRKEGKVAVTTSERNV